MGGLIKLVITMVIIGAGVKYFVFGEKSERDIIIDVAVRKINEQKGDMVDRETMLKGAYESSAGMVINYQLIDFQTVGFDRATFNKELLRTIKRNNCGKKSITDVLALDVSVNYVYYNATDSKIAEVVLDKNTCR